jgi:SulP family sulfate permease
VGASALLALDQLKHLLGLKAMGDAHDHFLVRFWLTMTQGGSVHRETFAIGVATIGLVVLFRLIKHRIGWTLFPDLFATVLVMAALVAGLGLDEAGVRVVGEIPPRLPTFHAPALDLDEIRELAPSAFAVAVLGLLEAIAMTKVIVAHSGRKLDMNQQCLSEGLANIAGSLFHCIPGSGSLTRSAINQQAGGRTQWSGVISAIMVAAIVLLFAPYARYIPRSALAGILMVASWRMIDWHALRYHLRASRFDAGIVLATAAAAVFVSVEFCVIIGIVLSFMLAVPRAGRMLLTEFVLTTDRVIHERMAGEEIDPRILLFGFEGEFFFGSAVAFENHLDHIESRLRPETRYLVLRLKRVRNPDAVCTTLLDAFVRRMEDRGVHVLMCGVRAELHDALERIGLLERYPDRVFIEQPVRNSSTLMAVKAAYDGLGGEARAEGMYYMI